METPNAPSERRSTERPSQRKFKAASLGSSPVRPLKGRTLSSAPGVTYNKTAWHVPSKCSNAAPTPALANLRNQCCAYTTMLWKYHGHRGRGTITARPKRGLNRTRGCRFLNFLLFSGLHSSKGLSGSIIAAQTIQPGEQKATPHYGTLRWSLYPAVYLFRITFRSSPLERTYLIVPSFAYRTICIVLL